VVDEYGGTAGIVSLEDLVEALVGEIRDEGEPVAIEGVAPDGSLVLDGLTPLVELRERDDLDLTADGIDVETLGGYVFARLARQALVGDEVPVATGVLRVEELDGLRVARVRFVPTASSAEEASDAGAGPSVRGPG